MGPLELSGPGCEFHLRTGTYPVGGGFGICHANVEFLTRKVGVLRPDRVRQNISDKRSAASVGAPLPVQTEYIRVLSAGLRMVNSVIKAMTLSLRV